MEKILRPESLQQHQRFLPHPYVNSTSMVVKRTLEQARKAKEKIDHALSEREMKTRSSSLPEKTRDRSNTNRSFILAKKALMSAKKVEKRQVNQEVDEEAEDTSSDTSSSEKERALDKIPTVEEQDDGEVEENYSEIAEDSDIEVEVEQKEEDTISEEDCSEKSDKTNLKKESISCSVSNIHTEMKTIISGNAKSNKNQTSIIVPKLQEDIIYPIKNNNNIINSNLGKGIEEKELVVIREKKIRSSSDTNSSLDKKLCSVNSDQGSSSCSSGTPVSKSSSNSNEQEEKIYEKKFKNINTDDNEEEEDVNSDDDDDDDDEITGSTSNNNTNESNSNAFMSEQQQQSIMFSAIDPESMMRNPWFENFYQRFQCRPNWDSSPYNPSCNRPAWDYSLYVEAKEKFQRHESVKLNNNNNAMMDFSNFPTCFSGSGMMDGSAYFDMNQFQKTYFQFGQMFGNRNRYVQTSKKVFSKIKNGPQNKKIISSGVGVLNEPNGIKKNLQNVTNNNNMSNNNNNNITPNGGGKDKTTNPTVTKVTSNNNSNDNNNYTSQGKLLGTSTNASTISQRAGSTESKASSFSTKSSILDTNNSNYNYNNNNNIYRKQRSRSCPKSSKVFQNTVNRRNEKVKNEPIKPQKLIPNPLPRVAHLTKASLRRTSEQSSNIQVIDERGRPRFKWNPSPFVSINKSSAWDENSSYKNDYFRLKYFGWM